MPGDHRRHQPVGFVSYGMASAGGNAVQMVKQVITALRMMPAIRAVAVSLRECVDADGALHTDKVMESAAAGMLDELARLTEALSSLRAPAAAGAGDSR